MSSVRSNSFVQAVVAFFAKVVAAVKSLVTDVEVEVSKVYKDAALANVEVHVLWSKFHSWVLVGLGLLVGIVLAVVLPVWASLTLVGLTLLAVVVLFVRFLANPANYK